MQCQTMRVGGTGRAGLRPSPAVAVRPAAAAAARRQQRAVARRPVRIAAVGNGNGNGTPSSHLQEQEAQPEQQQQQQDSPAAPAAPAASSQDYDPLAARISSGEFTDAGSTKERLTRPVRKLLAQDPIGVGRAVALLLARLGRQWRADAAARMPTARGDIREIVGQPVFVPLYALYLRYGKIFRLSFGPKSFVVVSDPAYVRQILLTNATKYSKGLLSEILDFVMGTGLIPADGEVWRVRRRAVVPALHRRYVASMVDMFGACAEHGAGAVLARAAASGEAVEMENFYSRLGLDIIGKAVFNYEFDSLSHDDPVIEAVYTALREAEYRSTAPVPYWNLPFMDVLVPRQRRVKEALKVINATLDGLIAKAKRLCDEEGAEALFGADPDEFLSEQDPSILHFMVASGDDITSKQLRDDLMTLLIAGHETTAAVLTWTTHLLSQHPEVVARMREEIDAVVGDGRPGVEQLARLPYTTRVVAESMRLYPQPPVLIRRALEDDAFDDYVIPAGSDIFISVWNLHRSPALWPEPDRFDPGRFPLDQPAPNEVTHDYAFLPFGGGRRKCVGDQFALFETVVALTMLLRRYDFAPAPGAPPVGMTTGATIHTTSGLWMSVTERARPPPAPAAGGSSGSSSGSNGGGSNGGGGVQAGGAVAGRGVAVVAAAAAAAAEQQQQQQQQQQHGSSRPASGGGRCPMRSVGLGGLIGAPARGAEP